MKRAIAYSRVSTEGQAESGLSLSAQKERLAAECQRRDWIPIHVSDVASGKNMKREGVQLALQMLGNAKADVLMVCKLDRISRSVIDFAQLSERAHKEGWGLVILDLDIDTSKPNGKLVAGIMAQLAEWERGIISERTKTAMAQAKAQGRRVGGSPCWQTPPDLSAMPDIRRMRKEGLTIRAIADALNASETPTPTGRGKWWANTIQRLLASKEAA